MTDTPPEPESSFASDLDALLGGLRATSRSVFIYVLFSMYVGIGALAHDFGFSLAWMWLSTILVWAAPAQVILITALGSGASLVEVAIAVGLSAVRFLPMVISLLPLVRNPDTRQRDLIMVAHLTAISMWVESIRLVPLLPRSRRAAFSNGLGLGFMIAALLGSALGYTLAAELPGVLAAALLFLTPMSFLTSVVRNSRMLMERLAFGLGLVVGPILVTANVRLDLLWTGIIAGTAAYLVHRVRQARTI